MRRVCNLMLAVAVAVAVVGCPAGELQAQTPEGPLQRLSSWLRPKAEPKKAATLEETKPQTPVPSRPAPLPYETRGVVYVEEATTRPGSATGVPSHPVVTLSGPVKSMSPQSRTPPAKLPTGWNVQPRTPATMTPAPRQAPTITTQSPTTTVSNQPVPAKSVPAKQQTTAPVVPAIKTAANDELAQRLGRQVSEAYPQARNIKVSFTSANEITVDLEVATKEECNAAAGAVFAVRSLDAYRVNLKFSVLEN